MPRGSFLAAALACGLLSGCSGGVEFSDVSMNKDLPDDYKNRVFWNQTDAFKYNLTELVGHVITGDRSTGEFQRGPRLVANGYEPTLQLIDDGAVYRSKVNRAAAAKGGYLLFTAEFEEKQAAEVAIIDTQWAFIPYAHVPVEQLGEMARQLPEGTSAYYVQAVVLATVTIQNFLSIQANAKAVVGDTFGASGNVFNETSDWSKDFKIALTLLPLENLDFSQYMSLNTGSQYDVAGEFTIKQIADVPLREAP